MTSALFVVSCAANKPVTGTGSPSTATMGTIAGIVSAGSTGTNGAAVTGRKVTATNTVTGAHVDTSTATNGGYTLKVPAGHYRIEVELRQGERLEKQPDPTDVGIGDLDADRNFLITR